MSTKTILVLASILGGLGVVVGAFGAHAFKAYLMETGRTDTFEVAVKYQFYHSLALLLVGILYKLQPSIYFQYASWSFVAGCIVFSGSLYLLIITKLNWLGAITPLGGVLFILGWAFLALGAIKSF